MMNKHDRLGERLAAIGAATIILSFPQVEAIIGPLPTAAWRYDARWWGAPMPGHFPNAHVTDWQRAGYAADRPDFAAKTVTFRRVLT